VTRLKLIIVLGFAIIFVAGLAVGSFVDLTPHAVVKPVPPIQKKAESHFPNFREHLGLSAAQNEQVEKLWHEAHARNESLSHQFRDIDHQYEEAVISLLAPEQKIAYEKIQKDRHDRVEALRGEMVKTMKATNQSIRALLTPEQQKKFDEMARQIGPPRSPNGRMGGGPVPMGGPHFHSHRGSPPDSNPVRPETAPTRPETGPS
jgi:Spy/CpxP family protein refolding chaperone